jgi:MSHA biogenesis protein MshP
MIRAHTAAARRQQGAALMTALFLLVVVAALGAFSIRLSGDQQQYGALELAQMRATQAANAGLEYWSNRVSADNNVACAAINLDLNAFRGFDGFTVLTSCVRIPAGPAVVYEITADATGGAYGTPEFVRRRLTRRISTLGTGTW